MCEYCEWPVSWRVVTRLHSFLSCLSRTRVQNINKNLPEARWSISEVHSAEDHGIMDRSYFSLVSDLTLAVSWVGTVSQCVAPLGSICSLAGPGSLLALHHSPLGPGDRENVGPGLELCTPPTPTSHCWLYAGSRALNSLAPAASAVLCTVVYSSVQPPTVLCFTKHI